MSNKIVVTGGAGYIGSHTIVELMEKTEYEIISLDNLSNSSGKAYKGIEQILNRPVTHYEIDLCDKDQLDIFFQNEKNIIGVIHFAAFKSVPESVENPKKYYYNNINSLLNIVEMCLTHKINNFIFSSSCSVYGNIDVLPVSEKTPLNKAVSPYAYTKQIGEQILTDFTKVFKNFNVIALRYFNPVGAHLSALIGEDPINPPTSLVPIITQTASGRRSEMFVHGTDYNTRDGSCVRDYIHVSDIAEAHLLALNVLLDNRNQTNMEIINLGKGNGVTVFEAIHSFEKVSGVKLNYKLGDRRLGDVEAVYSDTSKSKKILNWSPRYSLDEMMLSAWKWEVNGG